MTSEISTKLVQSTTENVKISLEFVLWVRLECRCMARWFGKSPTVEDGHVEDQVLAPMLGEAPAALVADR